MSELTSLTSLYEGTRRIGLSDSLSDVLDTVLEQAQELIGFDHCALMLYDPETEVLSVRRVRGYGDRSADVLRLRLRKGEGLSGWAVAHRQAVRVNDVTQDPRYVVGLQEARSNLAVPLIVLHEVAGVINVESERPDAFTEEHEKLLTVLGSQAALAILAARARERLQRRIGQLNALYRISQLAAAQDRLEDTLASILAVTEELVTEGQVAILLVDEETRSLVVRDARRSAGESGGVRIPLGQGITGKCAASGEVIVVDDVHQEPAYLEGVAGARSQVALPLKVEGRVIGVLNAEAPTAGAYSPDQVRALSVVAHQAAAVIRSAQLNEEARRLAVTDPLTGLHNRRYFVDKLEEHLQRARRYGHSMALVLADADSLKALNDRHGHLTGDRALQVFADMLRQSLRDTDELARIGGDEFAALLLEAGEERATTVVERLRQGLRQARLLSETGEPLDLSLSVGVALFPGHGSDARRLLQLADQALYRAKRSARSALVLVDGRTETGPCGSDAATEAAQMATDPAAPTG